MRWHARRMLTISYMFKRSEEKIGAPPSLRRDAFARIAIEHLHRDEHREHLARLARTSERRRPSRTDISRKPHPHRGPSGENTSCGNGFSYRRPRRHGRPISRARAHRPPERIDGANSEDGRRAVPTRVAQGLASILGTQRLKRPGGIRAEFRRDAELAQDFLRLDIARDHQGVAGNSACTCFCSSGSMAPASAP